MIKSKDTVSVGSSLPSYGTSLAAVAVAVVARMLLEPLLADSLPFITLYLAVGFAAWYGGRGPGLLALVASEAAAVFFLFQPRYSFVIDKSKYQVGLVLYGVAGFAVVAMFESLRKAQRHAEEQPQQLEQEVAARRATEQALAEQAERLRTTLASIGQAGVDVAGEFRLNVISLDIGLPKLNGHEACRCIREQPWGEIILVIAVTGKDKDDDRRGSKEVGFDHHMVKPVNRKALMKMLAE